MHAEGMSETDLCTLHRILASFTVLRIFCVSLTRSSFVFILFTARAISLSTLLPSFTSAALFELRYWLIVDSYVKWKRNAKFLLSGYNIDMLELVFFVWAYLALALWSEKIWGIWIEK